MDLRDYLRVLRKGWPVVLVFVAVGIAAGVFAVATTTKQYEASVQLFVATSQGQGDASSLQDGQIFTSDRVQSYTSLANSPSVTDPAAANLRVPGLTSSVLATKITADAPQNKTLLNIHITDGNAALSARIANAVAVQFTTVVENKFEQTTASGQPVVKLTVAHPASTPTSPVTPNKIVDIGLGLVLGLVAGLVLVLLRDLLDNTVKTSADFEDLAVPVLGMIPFDKRTTRIPIAFRGDTHNARSESYRQLRTNLQFVKVDVSPRIIAITSAIPGEGKSITSINLAVALAEAGHRVCLVEADLRRPTIGKTLGLITDVGFTTVLIGKTSLLDALQYVDANLAVLTSGPVPPNPSELLNSEQARSLIADVARYAEYTIIDTAPLLPVADGAEVATMAEATIIVHRAGKTTREQAKRSVAVLERVGERPVGVVLNMVRRSTGRSDYDYDYSYSYRPELDARHRSGDEGSLDLALNDIASPGAYADQSNVVANGHLHVNGDAGVGSRPQRTAPDPSGERR